MEIGREVAISYTTSKDVARPAIFRRGNGGGTRGSARPGPAPGPVTSMSGQCDMTVRRTAATCNNAIQVTIYNCRN